MPTCGVLRRVAICMEMYRKVQTSDIYVMKVILFEPAILPCSTQYVMYINAESVKGIISTHQEAGFNLRSFVSNSIIIFAKLEMVLMKLIIFAKVGNDINETNNPTNFSANGIKVDKILRIL